MDLSAFESALTLLRVELGDLQIQMIRLLVCVMNTEGLYHADISVRLDMPQSSVSRNVGKLGTYMQPQPGGGYEPAGLGLLRNEKDTVEDPRRLRVFLTDKGQALKVKLEQYLEGVKALPSPSAQEPKALTE